MRNGKYFYYKVDDKNLYLYIDNIQTTSYGKEIKVCVDKPIQISNREEGQVLVKETVELNVCLYEKPDELSNFLAVFSSTENARHFGYVMRLLVSKKVQESGQFPNLVVVQPMLPVRFRLSGKEKELSKYFSNVKELSVKNIKDIYIHHASLRGNYLEQSSEYQKYVRDMQISGDINYYGITFRDRVIMLSSEGKMWTRQGKSEVEPDAIEEILKILQNCNAVITAE
jgi:hypothetical protein